MATENEQSNATQQASKEQPSSQPTGLARRSHDGGMARHHRSGLLGLPLTPYEMLRMTPFSLFRRMTEEFDRALQPLLSDDETSASIAWTPTVEISERDGKYRILAELPGLSPNEVRVEVEDDALVLQGERQVEREATEGGIRRSERQFGFFYRRIPLPEGADPEQAKAKFHDGILEVTLPVPDRQAKRRQIQIEADIKPSADQTKQAA
jgi:HSP20 family protein